MKICLLNYSGSGSDRLSWPGQPWKHLTFSNSNFERIPVDERIEEELFPDYAASRYYPVRIGEVLGDRYQIAGKLGFGARSTFLREQLDHELTIYPNISSSSAKHPDHSAVRELLDSFDCHIIHTDIKADHIMFGIDDDSIFSAFEEQELMDPSPRKVVDGRSIYLSCELQMPKNGGAPVFCDFGSAVIWDKEHLEDVQPDVYTASGHQTYRNRARLAEVIALLVQPPQALLPSGKSSHKFFTDKGGESQEEFLAMMRKMLQWEPSERSSAKTLADDEWIMKNM
ncbi:serine threonine protein kinase, CMGC group [Trichoderma barbatum]